MRCSFSFCCIYKIFFILLNPWLAVAHPHQQNFVVEYQVSILNWSNDLKQNNTTILSSCPILFLVNLPKFPYTIIMICFATSKKRQIYIFHGINDVKRWSRCSWRYKFPNNNFCFWSSHKDMIEKLLRTVNQMKECEFLDNVNMKVSNYSHMLQSFRLKKPYL